MKNDNQTMLENEQHKKSLVKKIKYTLLGTVGMGVLAGSIYGVSIVVEKGCELYQYLSKSWEEKEAEKRAREAEILANKEGVARLCDSDLIYEIYRQENVYEKSHRHAVEDALYQLWQKDDRAVEDGEMTNAEFRIRAEVRHKRSRQYEQFDWTYVSGFGNDNNPFVEMILSERHAEIENGMKIQSSQSMPMHSQMSSEHVR